MPEVINLLSSPPVSPVRNAAKPRSRLSTSALFSIDDFDSTGDIDFASEQAAKRRKVSSPARSNSPPKKVKRSVLAALELSSEPDLPSPASVKGSLPTTSWFNTEWELSSDREVPSSSAPAKAAAGFGGRSKVADLDEIEFSSSAPVRSKPKTKAPKSKQVVHVLSSDDDNFELPSDDLLTLLNSRARSPAFSSTVMNVLAAAKTAATEENEVAQRPAKSAVRGKRSSKSGPTIEDDIEVSSPPKPARKPQAVKPKRDDMDKQEQRAAAKEAKAAAKEAEKLRKKDEKAERDREKQKAKDMADVNRSKANKKETSKEMIVQISASFEGTGIGSQVEAYMREHEVGFSFIEEEVDLVQDSGKPYPGKLVQWKRKVEATYDVDEGQWHPLPAPRVEPTDHVAIFIMAQEFAEIAVGKSTEDIQPVPDLELMKCNLDGHVTHLRRRHKDRCLIYLVQGLHAWVRRNDNAKNREYAAAVRAQVEAENATGAPTASQARKKKQDKNSARLQAVTADVVEDLQLYLQINHQPLVIHHTTSVADSASQILSFTQSLSSRPYRIAELDHNLKSASFFMGTGSCKTGENPEETFCRMLEGVQRITPSIAQSIASQWSSPRELVVAFRASDNLMLENVRKSTNKDGGYSDRRIGPVISKRIWKVLLGEDPDATSGMS